MNITTYSISVHGERKFTGTLQQFAEHVNMFTNGRVEVDTETDLMEVVNMIYGEEATVRKETFNSDGGYPDVLALADGELDQAVDFDSIIEDDLALFNQRAGVTTPMTLEMIKSEPYMYAAVKLAIQFDIAASKHATIH